MRLIIIGGGQVGTELAKRLSKEHDVVVIERNSNMAKIIESSMDVMVIRGSGASVRTLEKAGISEAKLLIAVTEIDEVNIIACMVAKKYGVETTVARIRNIEYVDGSQILTTEQLGIDIIINPERVAAQEITEMIKSPNVSEVEHYADGRVQVIGYYVNDYSPFINKRIEDVEFPDDCIVCAIIRKVGEVIIPSGEDKILAQDEIFLLGKKEVFEKPWPGFEIQRQPQNIVIAGGGKVGLQLAEFLERDEKYNITLVEISKEKCDDIAGLLNRTLVLQGNVTDINFLREEEIYRADVFVAVTGDDEINLLSTLLADHLGVKITISEVIRPDYNIILNSIGIDRVVSPRLLTAAQIMKLIRKGEVISLTILKEDKAEVLELIVPDKAYICDKKLEEAKLPRGILLGAIIRGDKVIIPSGSHKVFSGDRVIIFYTTELSEEVDKYFSVEAGTIKKVGKVIKDFVRGK